MPMGGAAGGAGAGASSGASAGGSTPSTSASSPDWYISATMSAPPTSSPRTKSWGMVGQLDTALSSWRMRGSGRMSTAANGASRACRAAEVRAEKPHMGCSGVPFMKRMTSFSEIACSIASRRVVGCSLIAAPSLLSGGLRLDGQGVDGSAHLGAEDVVHQAVLLDARPAREGLRRHRRPEVVAAAREILDLGPRPGDRVLDAPLDLLGGRHSVA